MGPFFQSCWPPHRNCSSAPCCFICFWDYWRYPCGKKNISHLGEKEHHLQNCLFKGYVTVVCRSVMDWSLTKPMPWRSGKWYQMITSEHGQFAELQQLHFEQKLWVTLKCPAKQLMEEILHHLGCIKPCKYWDIYHINWCRLFSINSMVSVNQKEHQYFQTFVVQECA